MADKSPRPVPWHQRTSRCLVWRQQRPTTQRPAAAHRPRAAGHPTAAQPLRAATTLSHPKAPAEEATTLTIVMLLALGLVVIVLALAVLATLTPTGILIGVVLLLGGIPALLLGIAGLRHRLRQQ